MSSTNKASAVLSFKTRLFYVFEQILAHVLTPLLLGLLVLRSRKEPAHLNHVSHRFGFGPKVTKGAIWVYAASLGETRAASPLVRKLRAAGHSVLLAHQSPAGMIEGARLFGDDAGVTQCYVPLDLFWAVRLFLRRAKPIMLIVMEIEIWPAMLIETSRKGIPMVMANGNLLEESIRENRGFRAQLLKLYRLFDHIFTRTDSYQDRYVRLGVDPSRISIVGELKFDQQINPAHLEMAGRLRAGLAGERILMIASSVEAEEPMLLPMVERLVSADPKLRVLWAPRSPQRFQAVADALSDMGVTVVQRSNLGTQMDAPIPPTQVLIGDSIGEMNAYYPAADLVFVGASLVDHGGHNIVEAFALGRPVVTGPSTFGIDFVAQPAAQAGAFESLPDVASLEARIAQLLADKSTLQKMSEAAAVFGADKTGAADKTVAGIASILPQSNKGPSK